MQTFLPYGNYKKFAKQIDQKRIWKQILEITQIFDIHFRRLNILKDGKKGWFFHPAVTKLWVDKDGKIYVYQLFEYMETLYKEFIFRGGHSDVYEKKKRFILRKIKAKKYQHLWGNKKYKLFWPNPVYKSMKANLIRKNPKYYRKIFGKKIRPQEEYVWENCRIKK